MSTRKKKVKKTPLPKASDLFTEEEIGDKNGVNLQGKLVIVAPSCFKPEFHQRKYLVWRAQGGFGCDPDKMGTGVFATCLGDGEEAKLCRSNIVGLFIGDETEFTKFTSEG